ncbi:MAG: aminotransferase class IV [Geminicoccaceae bacterium]
MTASTGEPMQEAIRNNDGAGPAYAEGIAHVDGEFCPVAEARLPLLDWGFLRSDACQDTVSVWAGAFFRLEDHLERFERSFTGLRMICPHERDQLRAIAMEAVRLTGFREAYLQMIMTRGRPPVGSRDLRLAENKFYMFCIPYMSIATADQQRQGLHLVVSDIRRIPKNSVDPLIKTYHWLDFEMGLFDAYDRGGDTVVLTDEDGQITEGPGFNLFAVKDGRLLTPDAGCLDGMTRKTVFELCTETNLDCEPAPIAAAHLADMDELFISSTAGGIMPVTKVDGRQVGEPGTGPVTARLRDLYWSKRQAGWHTTPIDYGDDQDD